MRGGFQFTSEILMMTIEQQHPEVAREFYKGNFVMHKSCKEFSSIAIDQAHEQNNAVIKDDGGAIKG